MNETITAWGTLIIAAGTLVSLWVAYRAFKSQVKSFASSVSADLALKLVQEFDSNASIEHRSRVANAFLNKQEIAEADGCPVSHGSRPDAQLSFHDGCGIRYKFSSIRNGVN